MLDVLLVSQNTIFSIIVLVDIKHEPQMCSKSNMEEKIHLNVSFIVSIKIIHSILMKPFHNNTL